MNIAIIGFGIEGRATYDFFANQGGHQLTVHNQAEITGLPSDVTTITGDSYLDDLDQYDLIVRTAGMHPRKILAKNPGVAAKITSHINEFFKASPTTNIIGVTGTKGKGTTSTIITRMLEESGKTVRLGGNIGVPPLTFIDELDKDSWVVLELSSFQLIDLKQSPHVAVCLMVVPEHLDWHTDMDEYLTAKEQLFARQATADVAIYYHDNANSKRIAGAGQAMKVPYYHFPGAEVVQDGAVSKIVIEGEEICRTDELKLLGQHNWQNACAAITAVWYACLEVCGPGQKPDIAAMRQVLTTFSGLEHRLEFVRELDGVKYYDDSFGTTPETAEVAIQAFQQPKVVILGGSVKGTDFTELGQTLATNEIRKVILIGNTSNPDYVPAAPQLEAAFQTAGFDNYASLVQDGGPSMAEVIATAKQQAQPGDIVLLSTGCASFDMFKDYKDRGNQFKQAVLNL